MEKTVVFLNIGQLITLIVYEVQKGIVYKEDSFENAFLAVK